MAIEGCRTIVFDQRGFGKTAWVPGPYSNRADCLSVLDHLRGRRGHLGWMFQWRRDSHAGCGRRPGESVGLVLVGGSPRGWEPESGWEDDPLWDLALAAAEAGDLDEMAAIDARLWLAGSGRRLQDLDAGLVELFHAMDSVPIRTEGGT